MNPAKWQRSTAAHSTCLHEHIALRIEDGHHARCNLARHVVLQQHDQLGMWRHTLLEEHQDAPAQPCNQVGWVCTPCHALYALVPEVDQRINHNSVYAGTLPTSRQAYKWVPVLSNTCQRPAILREDPSQATGPEKPAAMELAMLLCLDALLSCIHLLC